MQQSDDSLAQNSGKKVTLRLASDHTRTLKLSETLRAVCARAGMDEVDYASHWHRIPMVNCANIPTPSTNVQNRELMKADSPTEQVGSHVPEEVTAKRIDFEAR